VAFGVYGILVAHAFFGCIWNGLSNLITSLNLHSRYVRQLIAWNLIGVVVLFVTVPHFGLYGAAFGIAFIDFMSFVSVYRAWNRIVPPGWRDFTSVLFKRLSVRQ